MIVLTNVYHNYEAPDIIVWVPRDIEDVVDEDELDEAIEWAFEGRDFETGWWSQELREIKEI